MNAETLTPIITSIDDGLLVLELCRPQKRNALTMEMFSKLAEELILAANNQEVRAILILGRGNDFTAGHDLSAFDDWPQKRDDPVPRFIHALAAVSKPLVIAVQGNAMGIGATMLLHADWSCCTADARLKLPFVDLSIGPEAASSLLLSNAIGSVRARRIMLTGEAFTGQNAYDWGLVTELVGAGYLHAHAAQRARALGSKPSASFTHIKQSLRPPADEIVRHIDAEIDFINRSIEISRSTQTTP
jgi:enoyl-CoA hydratase/carnithine racemase